MRLRPPQSAIMRPMTSTYHGQTSVGGRPQSTFSYKRPISGQTQVNSERFFTRYSKEAINIGDDIPFEELFDRNERTMCATFAKFGDLSYHTPNYRVGNYEQFPAKLKLKHLQEIIGLQNTITNIEKNEFEIPIQLSVIDEVNPFQKKLKTGISSVFKKEEVEREPITVSLFPEYFQDSDPDDELNEKDSNREALKYLQQHLLKMGGHYDPDKMGKDDYTYIDPTTFPSDIMSLLNLSYRRFERYLTDPSFIRTEEIAKYKKEWISNAIVRVPERLLKKEDELIRILFQEIFADYRQAVKKGILEYILLSGEERRRLSIHLLLRESPSSAYRIVKAGAYSVLLYHEWHSYVESSRHFLQNSLYNMNIVNSSLLSWNQDFQGVTLVESQIVSYMAVLGKSMSALSFCKIQRNYRDRVRSFMRHVWLKGAILIMKKFKMIRVHREKKGCWSLLGFSQQPVDLALFFRTSFDDVSNKVGEGEEDSAEAIFNVISTRLNNALLKHRVLDIPLDRWGDMDFSELLDIRDCPSYQYYSQYNKEPILLSENGYKLLDPDVKAKLRASVGVLLAIKLREKIEISLKIFEDLILARPMFSEVQENDRKKQQDLANKEASIKAQLEMSEQEVLEVAPLPQKKAGLVSAVVDRPLKEQLGKIIGPEFEFNEMRNLVEPIDVFFLQIRFSNPAFLRLGEEFQPFLQLEMVVDNEIIRFSDSEESLRVLFLRMHGEVVDLFKGFPHPEYLSVELKEDSLETHPKESFPPDNNYEAFYRRFMPKLELREKKRKRKVQSILESAQVEEVDEKVKNLNVNESSERQYVESSQRIIGAICQQYNESKIAFSIFDQFRLVFDKTLDKYARQFVGKNHIALEEYRKNLVIIRAYKALLQDVPDEVYFPLFEVRTGEVKKYIRRILEETEKMVIERVKEFLTSELDRIKGEFQRLRDTMQKPIENATQYQQMDTFMTGLTQEKIQLRNKSHEMYKKLLFCSRLYSADIDLLGKAREVHECPTMLESSVVSALVKHQDYKAKIIKELEVKTTRFLAQVQVIDEGLGELKSLASFGQYLHNTALVKDLDAKLLAIEDDKREINDQEVKLFGKSKEYKDVIDLRRRLSPAQELWESVNQFMLIKNGILKRKVFEVNLPDIEEALSNAERSLNRLRATFGKSPDEMKIVDQFDVQLGAFQQEFPTITVVCNKGLGERHWNQIKQVLSNAAFNYREDSLGDLLEKPEVSKNIEALKDISRGASTEYKLLQLLNKVEGEWKDKRFELLNWKNTDILIFGGTAFEDIQMLLDDHVIKVQTIRSDPGVKFIENEARAWEETLVFMQQACEVWVKVQQAYVYLVPVFNSEDIRTHMAKAATEFKKVQGVWEDLMHQVADNPSATDIQKIPELLPKLKGAQTSLEFILKELDDYLDMKRTKFCRFYFLSNEEMLSILSETKDPQLVQPHLKKCFEGVNELIFTVDNDITGMKSEMGEVVDFETKIVPKNYKSAVEEWLVKIEEQMRVSLRAKADEAFKDLSLYTGSRQQWLKAWPGQCVIACSQISWTMLVEHKLKTVKQMKELKEEMGILLEEIVRLIRGELSPVERMTLNALITLEVHNLDIVQELVANRCTSVQDFDWLSQLRYYQAPIEKSISVEMVVTKLDYGFEYLGNTPRLVITPLTDRCYRTLMSALFLNLGGAPEGPAGTGKTETTKDLAKAVAIHCVVTNCTGSLNAGAMAKFFKGLISVGAWSCFDEFNRIQLEVLSVIAQQIHQIQTAKSLKVKEFRFEGAQLKLKESCNIFITMNPGYAGRSELPDNLKALFRPVAMMVPDYATIGEISLYSTGFIEARRLARKIVSTYKLCSELLSSQYHYDYGMRTVKSVLITAAMLKIKMKGSPEEDIIMLSIKDVNLPKFVSQDIDIFKAILQDLFPENTLDERENSRMDEMMNRSMKTIKHNPHPAFKLKVYQLNEMIKTRHGLMLVGEAMSGKSTVYKILANTLNSLAQEGDEELKVTPPTIINPKAITINELYGVSDSISQEWTEGVLSFAFKGASKRNKTREWLVLDGPVEAEWIENMNTVLDDNKCLCLMSSDKIPMSKYMTMIFETENLAKASPATVSRCGMIYLAADLVGTRNYYSKWLKERYEGYFDAELLDHMLDLYDILYRQSIKFIESSKKQYQYISEMSLTQAFVSFLSIMLTEAEFVPGKPVEEELSRVKSKLNILFMHAIAWSLGMTTLGSFRKEFDKFLRRICVESVKSEINKDRIVKFDKDIAPPEHSGSMMVDYTINYEYWNWVPTKEVLVELDQKNMLDTFHHYQDICVETEETLRIRQVMKQMNKYRVPLLIIGPTGIGKTQIINSELASHRPEDMLIVKMNFAARTTPEEIRENFMSKVDKKKRGTFGPKGVGQKGVWFIDDLNLPSPDTYGFQPPLELLRQYLEFGGWYDLEELKMLHIVDFSLLCAIAPPGGARSSIPPRLLRHFYVYSSVENSASVLIRIFTKIVKWICLKKGLGEDSLRVLGFAVEASIELFTIISEGLKPTPAKPHYLFNLRDISKIFQGVNIADPKQFQKGSNKICRLWIHETYRVMADRLLYSKDKDFLYQKVKYVLNLKLRAQIEQVMLEILPKEHKFDDSYPEMDKVIFTNLLAEAADLGDREYTEQPDLILIRKKVEMELEELNSSSTKREPMSISIFDFAVLQILKICRILKLDKSHGLLLGLGGSGRQTLTRLSTYMMGQQLVTLEVHKAYNQEKWREDIKRILGEASVTSKCSTLVITESQSSNVYLMQDIDSMLNLGEIPNLYEHEEFLKFYDKLKEKARREGEDKLAASGTILE